MSVHLPVLTDNRAGFAPTDAAHGDDAARQKRAIASARAAPEPVISADGKVHADAIELPIVHQCNLTCRGCTHQSPALRHPPADVDQLARDLATLSGHLAVDHVRVLGGEPLLHPRLIDILKLIRNSRIAQRTRVVTNGVLLWRQTDSFWQHVDEVHVSVYPGSDMTAGRLASCRERARAHGVQLSLNHYDRFFESYSEQASDDSALVQR